MDGVASSLSRIACAGALVALAAAQQPAAVAPAQAPAPETSVLEGRVVDMRGEPVPAAEVWAAMRATPDVRIARTVADGEGFFRMRVERRPGMRIHATSDGRCRGAAGIFENERLVRVELHDAATVHGVLRNRDGRPLQGVIVRASMCSMALWNVQVDARTDADGKFELTGVPLGPVRVSAWVAGEGLAEVEQRLVGDADVALAPASRATTDLRIEVTGLPAGAIERAKVSLLRDDQGTYRPLPPPLDTLRLDATGVLALHGIPDQGYRVAVGADGFVVTPHQLLLEAAQRPHSRTFSAVPAPATTAEWRATVRGPDGAPVAGAAFVMRAAAGATEARATSDAAGALTFRCPVAAGAKARVWSADPRWVVDQPKVEGMLGFHDHRFLKDHECTPDPSAPLELRVMPACTVRGRLCAPDGRPAAYVDVQLEEQNTNRTPEWMPLATVATDRDGAFVFPGVHPLVDLVRVASSSAAGAVTGEPLSITPAGTKVDVPDLKLLAPASISGVVFDAQQRPAPGVRVWLRDYDLATRQQRSGSYDEVITDKLGRYRFVGVPAGGAYLQMLVEPAEAHPSGMIVQPFDVEPGAAMAFDLQLPGK